MGVQKVKIGIDISQVVYGTGVSKYTDNLLSALLALDKKNEYIFFGGSIRRLRELRNFIQTLEDKSSNASHKLYPISPMLADFIWNKIHNFPIESFIGNVDVFHSSDWSQPPARRAKLVTTIHDLVPILYPESSHPKIVATHTRRLEWVKKEVDRVVAVSESTKRDIVKYLGIPAKKISVVYEAPDKSVKKMGENTIGEVRQKYDLPKEYLLAIGANPRKNIERIVQAVQKVNDAPPLVVIGREWSNLNVGSHNILLGHVQNDMEYTTLLSGASVLVYPSLYEGFGLPILDAFVCAVPVVTSNLSSMPEVAGDAAVLVDPMDIDSIAHGIEKALFTRSDLVTKGLVRVKQFSWEKAARETLEVYKEVAG